MKRTLTLIAAALTLAACAQKAPKGPLPVIPAPHHTFLDGGLASKHARIETALSDAMPAEGYSIEASRSLIKVTGGSEAGVSVRAGSR